jgi:hypothetical protein
MSTLHALQFTCKRYEEDYNPLQPEKYDFILLIRFYLGLASHFISDRSVSSSSPIFFTYNLRPLFQCLPFSS